MNFHLASWLMAFSILFSSFLVQGRCLTTLWLFIELFEMMFHTFHIFPKSLPGFQDAPGRFEISRAVWGTDMSDHGSMGYPPSPLRRYALLQTWSPKRSPAAWTLGWHLERLEWRYNSARLGGKVPRMSLTILNAEHDFNAAAFLHHFTRS